jgi:hypothetical protein
LFLSSFEAEVLLASAPPIHGPVSPDFCPFQVDHLCSAREPRPLGCRIYFCDPNYAGVGERIMESAIAQLKQFASEHDLPWRYAPLHEFLTEAISEGRDSSAKSNGRTRLLVVK